jgi:hypothetical protein
MSTESNNELEIARQFYNFANNVKFRAILLSEAPTTQTLVSSLSSSQPEVIKVSLETIFILATDPQTASQTAKIDGLLVVLAHLVDYDVDCEQQSIIKRLAQQNMSCLGKASRRASNATNANGERVLITQQQGKAFGSKYNHQVTFSLPKLEKDEDKNTIEKTLIHTRGTIAVTVDLSNKTANCFTSLEVAAYVAVVTEALAQYGAVQIENTKKTKRPGQTDAALVSYKNKPKAKKQQTQQEEAGWLGGITSYFW